MKATLLPTLQGASFLGPKSQLKSIFEAEKLIWDPNVDLKSKKSILSTVFFTKNDLIRTHLMVLSS